MATEIADGALRSARLECVPSKKRKEKILDRVITTLLSESRFNPLHYISTERRRDIWGAIAKYPFPSIYPEGVLDKPPGLKKVEELARQGYGLIIATRHFSERDFLMLTGFFRDQSEISNGGRETYAPLAYHQYTRGAKRLLEYHGVIPWPIVTTETIRKRRNFDTHGNKLRPGEGSVLFQSATVGLLNRGGILFEALSATRTLTHEPPRLIKPIEQIIDETGDKVAVTIVGLDIKDSNVISYEGRQGYNFGTVYLINIGDTLTKQELKDKARKQGIGVDRLVANEMALLVRPETLGDVYKDLREQRLAQAR